MTATESYWTPATRQASTRWVEGTSRSTNRTVRPTWARDPHRAPRFLAMPAEEPRRPRADLAWVSGPVSRLASVLVVRERSWGPLRRRVRGGRHACTA